MSIAAHWTPDCQGKQDFDGPIIEISTRFWPSGGGFTEFHGGKFLENEDRPQIRPSAHSSIILKDRKEDHDITISEAEFTGDTEDEVKLMVENWANEQWSRIKDSALNAWVCVR